MSRILQLAFAAVPRLSVWVRLKLASRLLTPNLEYGSNDVVFDGFSKRVLGGGLCGDSLRGGTRTPGTMILLGACCNLPVGVCSPLKARLTSHSAFEAAWAFLPLLQL